jgi:hypothetical protein
VSTRPERLRLETERHVIEGVVQLPTAGYRSRTTDFFNAHGGDFIPVTDAEVRFLDATSPPERHAFLAVSARHVVLVCELPDAAG